MNITADTDFISFIYFIISPALLRAKAEVDYTKQDMYAAFFVHLTHTQ